jgi:hypothetical protein
MLADYVSATFTGGNDLGWYTAFVDIGAVLEESPQGKKSGIERLQFILRFHHDQTSVGKMPMNECL